MWPGGECSWLWWIRRLPNSGEHFFFWDFFSRQNHSLIHSISIDSNLKQRRHGQHIKTHLPRKWRRPWTLSRNVNQLFARDTHGRRFIFNIRSSETGSESWYRHENLNMNSSSIVKFTVSTAILGICYCYKHSTQEMLWYVFFFCIILYLFKIYKMKVYQFCKIIYFCHMTIVFQLVFSSSYWCWF